MPWNCTKCGKKDNVQIMCEGDGCYEPAPDEWNIEEAFTSSLVTATVTPMSRTATGEGHDDGVDIELLMLELDNFQMLNLDDIDIPQVDPLPEPPFDPLPEPQLKTNDDNPEVEPDDSDEKS